MSEAMENVTVNALATGHEETKAEKFIRLGEYRIRDWRLRVISNQSRIWKKQIRRSRKQKGRSYKNFVTKTTVSQQLKK